MKTRSLCAEHEMRKVDIPFMRWNVWAFCHVTKIAEVAMIDYFPVVGLLHPIDFQRWGFVDQIEKSREGLAQANAAATTMTDVIDPPQFGKKFFLVEKFRIPPIDRMSGWGLDTALADWIAAHIGHGRVDCMAVERNCSG